MLISLGGLGYVIRVARLHWSCEAIGPSPSALGRCRTPSTAMPWVERSSRVLCPLLEGSPTR